MPEKKQQKMRTINLTSATEVSMDIEIATNPSADGNYRLSLVIHTKEGTILMKGFRVDKHQTDVMMPVLPMGNFTSPFYLAGMSPAIRQEILDKLKLGGGMEDAA